MSNLSIFEKKWIDLVFEGKNKAYGAYQLRQESTKTTLLAFISGIAFITVVFGVGLFLSSFGAKPVVTPKEPTDVIIKVDNYAEPKREEPKTVEPPASSAQMLKFQQIKTLLQHQQINRNQMFQEMKIFQQIILQLEFQVELAQIQTQATAEEQLLFQK